MSNFTFVRLTKLQPLFKSLGTTYAALAAINNTYNNNYNNNNNNNNNYNSTMHSDSRSFLNDGGDTDKVLLLIEDNNYLHTYDHRSTSTIILMIVAWILLIFGFVFCCCAECFGVRIFRGKKCAQSTNDNVNNSSSEQNQLECGANGGGGAIALSSNSGEDRANRSEPVAVEICRRCPPDYEVESLPSYTIVSGLPTYDDALEEFRKAGIILTPSFVPVIKIFESHEANGAASKDIYSVDNTQPPPSFNEAVGSSSADTISLSSTTCTCGGGSLGTTGTVNAPHPLTHTHGGAVIQPSMLNFSLPTYNPGGGALSPQVIELSPEHLAALSQKRLSLQISFNNSVRRQSRSGSTLRNNLLRSRAVGNTAGLGPIDTTGGGSIAMSRIHRSSSTNSLTNEQNLLDQRLRHLHHRGSLY